MAMATATTFFLSIIPALIIIVCLAIFFALFQRLVRVMEGISAQLGDLTRVLRNNSGSSTAEATQKQPSED